MGGTVAGDGMGAVVVAATAWGHQILKVDERGDGEKLPACDGGDDLLITRSQAGISGAGVEEQRLIKVTHQITVPVVLFGILA